MNLDNVDVLYLEDGNVYRLVLKYGTTTMFVFSKKLSGYYMYCTDGPCMAIIEFLDSQKIPTLLEYKYQCVSCHCYGLKITTLNPYHAIAA